jgi:hypothetical protein
LKIYQIIVKIISFLSHLMIASEDVFYRQQSSLETNI